MNIDFMYLYKNALGSKRYNKMPIRLLMGFYSGRYIHGLLYEYLTNYDKWWQIDDG